MTKDTKKTTNYTMRSSGDAVPNAEGQNEAIRKYVEAKGSQTYQEWHSERTKRGIREARERRFNAAAIQATDNQNLGGWMLIADMIRSELFSIDDVAKVAHLWSVSRHGDVWPAVRRVRETLSDRLELLDVMLKVLEKADLWNVAQQYVNDCPDFLRVRQ